MIFESLNFEFDVEKLKNHLRNSVLALPPHMVGPYFGGWSILSSNGSYRDGWASGERAYQSNFMPGATFEQKRIALGIYPTETYSQPTEICTGYLADVMSEIEAAGLQPRRARVSLLKAHGKSSWHRDGRDDEYAVRLHVPIFTNEKCFFECEEGTVHLPADGHGCLLRVNRMHKVINDSDEDRIHLIMSVRDTKGISKHHRYPEPAESRRA